MGPGEGNTYLRSRGNRITNWRPAWVTQGEDSGKTGRERQSESRREGRGGLYGTPSLLLRSSEV